MRVRAIKPCYIANNKGTSQRRKAGEEFDIVWKGKLPEYLEEVSSKAAVSDEPQIATDSGRSARDLKALLDAAGVEYKSNASKAKLEELLAEATANAAPAASTAPDKSRDVI